MVVIHTTSLEDFLKAVEKNTNPRTHFVLLEEGGYLVLVPVVTSRHRHYIVLDASGEEIEKARVLLEKRGYQVIVGSIEWRCS